MRHHRRSRVLRRARVYFDREPIGVLEERPGGGFRFVYDAAVVERGEPAASWTLPVRPEPYESEALFPFFRGLLAEGGNRAIQHRVLRIDERDDFGLLLETARDPIGAVWVEPLA